jgi:hypothetical protein
MVSCKRGNFVAKDLRTLKYRIRIIPLAKQYNRKKENAKFRKELNCD